MVENPGFNPDAKDNNRLTPFYLAAAYGHIPLASVLLERGANYLVKCLNQYSSLYIAVENNHLPFLRWFLGALSVEQRIELLVVQDQHRNTALHKALSRPELLKLLLEGLSLESRVQLLEMKSQYGNTVLHLAASRPESLKFLLEGLSIEQRVELLTTLQRKDGASVLHFATSNPESLKLLLEGLSIEQRVELLAVQGQVGNSVLHEALSQPQSLKLLLDGLSEEGRVQLLEMKNQYGNTVLHLAASHSEPLKLLLEGLSEEKRFELLRAKNQHGYSVLYRALSCYPESLGVILEMLCETTQRQVLEDLGCLRGNVFLGKPEILDEINFALKFSVSVSNTSVSCLDTSSQAATSSGNQNTFFDSGSKRRIDAQRNTSPEETEERACSLKK
ncbi:ankyrin repeat domain-containing protein [Legionella pneumophila serogroup 1]